MADAEEKPKATQSQCKKAKAKAEKVAKKKPDPAGLEMLAKGEAALKEKNFEEALAAFEEAKRLCENSSAKREKKAKAPPDPEAAAKKAAAKAAAKAEEEKDAEDESLKHLRPPSENKVAKLSSYEVPEGKNYAINTDENLAANLAATGGRWRTRFPPEPNGYLHIGHAKAMNFVFGVAKRGNGGESHTYLRFDDTNPAAEKQEYIDAIKANVAWLGHTPLAVTTSSEHFGTMYDMAERLIRQGDAYVCHQTGAEIKASRDAIQEAKAAAQKSGTAITDEASLPEACFSPYRSRSVDENLKLFRGMRRGRFAEGECCLRMKCDLASDIPSMWDPTAYRIIYQPHPHSGDQWCIYPTYDYTHCIIDSLENITHSLCTLEFGTRQAPDGSYYWLLDKLGLYKPQTWESARLNITYTLMSKRKLKALVEESHVRGWDDPRLYTLAGLKRRGHTGSSINKFCEVIGVSRNDGTFIRDITLDRCIRQELDDSAARRFGVVEPLRVVLTNYTKADGEESFTCANHPKKPEMGERTLPFGRVLFIEKSDFREEDQKGYFGLAPGKEVRLLQAYNITCTGVSKRAADGSPIEIECEYDADTTKLPKGKIHWVSEASAVDAEVRLYDRLFTVENPAAAEDWRSAINPDSLIVSQGKLEASLAADARNVGKAFQFQRLGYFCVDQDSTEGKLVINRTTTLREASSKGK